MKKTAFYFSILILILFFYTSCDRVQNQYPKHIVDIDESLIYGMSLEEYKNNMWPVFTQNTNTDVNVLLEDFTGHRCQKCPRAALGLHEISNNHIGRVFGVAIHAGPYGTLDLQIPDAAPFLHDFTNPQGIQLSYDLPPNANDFFGNPSVTINRKIYNDFMFQGLPELNYQLVINQWNQWVSDLLTINDLQVNLQSKLNYFPETNGFILHTEVDVLNVLPTDLYQTVYLIEDSLIAPQKVPDDWNEADDQILDYVHRDIHRGCIDGQAMGRKLVEEMKVDKNGNVLTGNKYYLNYSYKLPAQYNPDNMHLLIFVYRKDTKEVLQVIKQEIIE